MVDRFVCEIKEQNPGGDWVLYDDYQGLASLQEELMKYYENMNSENMNEIEALEAKLARLVKAARYYLKREADGVPRGQIVADFEAALEASDEG